MSDIDYSKKEYAYSEIFYSMQGEGHYTGEPTAWLRFFMCNLQCDGFGQKDPTNPDTYELPYKDIDVTDITDVKDLPVFKFGCDSSYSWAKKFNHLQQKTTPDVIAERILDVVPNRSFDDNIHLCFTGGEPLMPLAQMGSIEVLKYLETVKQKVKSVTYESNGTQRMRKEFWDYWANWNGDYFPELFMSFSPKLHTVSGELRKKAIKPDIMHEWYSHYRSGQLKFVVNGTKECWDELEEVVEIFRQAGVMYPVWIMPLGGTVEGQKGEIEGHIPAHVIADEALARGYRVSARVHAYLWENIIGK